MIKYIFFTVSLFTLFGIQLFIYFIFHDINNQLDYFYKAEIKHCKIENTIERKFTIGKGFYTQIETNCGSFPILLEDGINKNIIKIDTYITKKSDNNTFKIISKNKKHTFIIASYKKYEIIVRILSFILTLIVIIITYLKFW